MKYLAALLLTLAPLAQAAPVVIVPGSTGHVQAQNSAGNAQPTTRATLPCYWKVPRLEQWVNTNALTVTLGRTGRMTLYYGYRQEVEIEAAKMAEGSENVASFFARIEQCRQGL